MSLVKCIEVNCGSEAQNDTLFCEAHQRGRSGTRKLSRVTNDRPTTKKTRNRTVKSASVKVRKSKRVGKGR